MRKRLALALAVVLAAGAVAAVALAGGNDEPGRLAWSGKTTLIRPEALPNDRILNGQVRNVGLREIEVEAGAIRVVDARGRPIDTAAIFLSGFAHGLWPPGQAPTQGSDFQRRRLGKIAQLKPGKTVPLTVSWRRTRGAGSAARIELGEGRTLPLPRTRLATGG